VRARSRRRSKGARSRSYFGIYTVKDHPESKLRQLVHGTTLHGQQSTDPARAREASTYYGATSGVGLVLDSAPAFHGPARGSAWSAWGPGRLPAIAADQRWTFFEIDPRVVAYSRDGTFTYLSAVRAGCPDGARRCALTLAEQAATGSFDMLAIDAFSSDAIPLHLITREAVWVYLRALSPDGLMLLHISNRFIELEPVVAAIARDLGLAAMRCATTIPTIAPISPHRHGSPCHATPRSMRLRKSSPDAPWGRLLAPAPRAWTDDRASILPFIRWSRLLGSL
jgi:hypothetical protein